MALQPSDVPDSFEKPIEVKAQVSDAGPCAKKLALSVSAAEVDKVFDTVLRDLAGQVQVPGFRPGKVPRNVVERILKGEVTKRVMGETVARAFQTALKNEKIEAIGEPKLDLEHVQVERGKGLEFDVEVDVKPALTLGTYKGLPVEQEEVEVFDDEVEGELTELARRHADSVEAPADATVQDEDMMLGALRYTLEGNEIFNAPEHGLFLHQGQVFGAYGELDKKFLEGAKAGEKRNAEMTVNDQFPVEEHRGKKVGIEFEVKGIRRAVTPPVDDELAKKVGVKDLETLKTRIREQIHEALSERVKEKVRHDLVERVIGNSPFELPKRLLDAQGVRTAMTQARMLSRLGMSDEHIEQQKDEIRKTAAESAERELRTFFVLDAIAHQEKIEVGDDEVDEEVVRIARQRRMRAEQLFEELKSGGELDVMKSEIRQRKAMDFLVEQAEVKVVPRKKPVHGEPGHVHGPGCSHGTEAESAPKEAAGESEPKA
jgi:trigger factor